MRDSMSRERHVGGVRRVLGEEGERAEAEVAQQAEEVVQGLIRGVGAIRGFGEVILQP